MCLATYPVFLCAVIYFLIYFIYTPLLPYEETLTSLYYSLTLSLEEIYSFPYISVIEEARYYCFLIKVGNSKDLLSLLLQYSGDILLFYYFKKVNNLSSEEEQEGSR